MTVVLPIASPAASRGGRIVAVASGKGGVGKTWCAITLAHALARSGAHVLLFDGDLGLANIDIQLGLTPPGDLASVAAGRLTLEAAVLHHDAGFDIIAGCSGSGALASLETARLEALLAALRSVAPRYDLLLLDLGAGLAGTIRRMTAFADTLLVVVTEEPTSLTDAYAVLKLHAADTAAAPKPAPSLVLVNQAGSRAAGERTFATLARVADRFLGRAPELAGVIRRDDRVRDAIRRQELLLTRHPACIAAQDVTETAAVLRSAA
jgi:flagellar biosynthesis protein FlhG